MDGSKYVNESTLDSVDGVVGSTLVVIEIDGLEVTETVDKSKLDDH